MPWQDDERWPGAQAKPLAGADHPEGECLLLRLAPGGAAHELEHERLFCLGGALTLEGVPVHQGVYVEGEPGGVHSVEVTSPVGCTLLAWRAGLTA